MGEVGSVAEDEESAFLRRETLQRASHVEPQFDLLYATSLVGWLEV
jgi:hypothetical protein